MIDFVDKTSEQEGTPLNRANLMALQGFQATEISVDENNVITETDASGATLQIYPLSLSGIIEYHYAGVSKEITLNIRLADGKIKKELL